MPRRPATTMKMKIRAVDFRLEKTEEARGKPESQLHFLAQSDNPLIFLCPFCKRMVTWLALAKRKRGSERCLQRWTGASQAQRAAWLKEAKRVKNKLEFHHHLPLSAWGALNSDVVNLQPLCSHCHRTIEQKQHAAYTYSTARRFK